MNSSELEDRLIQFSVSIIKIADKLKNTRAGTTVANQMVRSGISPALNYGEAQSAESKNDFIHKIQITLKELRETQVALKITKEAQLHNDIDLIDEAIKENDELVSIFVSTVNTLRKGKSRHDQR